MNLNIKELFDETLKNMLPDLTKTAKEHFRRFFDKKISLYFADQQEIQRMKDVVGHAWGRGINVNDPDLGLANKMANDFFTENILNDDYKAYMKQYMDDNWKKELHAAMDKAMKHKANAIAFKEIRKVGGPERACVVLFEILEFLKSQGQAVSAYSSLASTDWTEVCLPYKIKPELVNSFAIAFPKCTVNIEDGKTSLKIYYDEHVNQQVK